MLRIIKIGMDVHSTTYTLCALEPQLCSESVLLASEQVGANPANIVKFVNRLKERLEGELDITCGYEAGCLGFALYHSLVKEGIKCVILAPTTMRTEKGKRIKTDARDARQIADCLASNGYHAVHIPTDQDEDVRCYLRMRDDHKQELKKIKQRINSFCLSQGMHYEKGKWTGPHLKWLSEQQQQLTPLRRETLEEYLITYHYLTDKIERFDQRIEELAGEEVYVEKVKKLCCFGGIKTHTALAVISEVGDFHRFPKATSFAAYLGLVPGENSSGNHTARLSITKMGNVHLRTLLVECAGSICRGQIGYKSKALKKRQEGNSPEVIEYADHGNVRLRRKYYKMLCKGRARNVAVTAVAREMACFIWGMMTDNYGVLSDQNQLPLQAGIR